MLICIQGAVHNVVSGWQQNCNFVEAPAAVRHILHALLETLDTFRCVSLPPGELHVEDVTSAAAYVLACVTKLQSCTAVIFAGKHMLSVNLCSTNISSHIHQAVMLHGARNRVP